MDPRRIDDPDRPFSAARVAIWALGTITLVAVCGMIGGGDAGGRQVMFGCTDRKDRP